MLEKLLAPLALAALCASWVLFQRWIKTKMPEAPGVENKNCNSCKKPCDRDEGKTNSSQSKPCG